MCVSVVEGGKAEEIAGDQVGQLNRWYIFSQDQFISSVVCLFFEIFESRDRATSFQLLPLQILSLLHSILLYFIFCVFYVLFLCFSVFLFLCLVLQMTRVRQNAACIQGLQYSGPSNNANLGYRTSGTDLLLMTGTLRVLPLGLHVIVGILSFQTHHFMWALSSELCPPYLLRPANTSFS